MELVPVPAHGAQISALAPTKGFVQTGTRAKSEQGLNVDSFSTENHNVFSRQWTADNCVIESIFSGNDQQKVYNVHVLITQDNKMRSAKEKWILKTEFQAGN